MALSRDVVIRLLGDAKSAVDAQKAAADAAGVAVTAYRRAEREHDKLTRAAEVAARKQREAMESVGRGSMLAGAAVVAGLGMAVKAAVNWESAWTGVLKTVDGSPAELAKLENGLRGLARTLPATHEEIAGVAEAAGQLGVKTNSVVEFTRVMVDLGETTNLSADEAATSIAQMMNVMQTAPGDVDRMGSTLVALGNAGASTEKQIVEMSQRISGAAAVVGLSEDEVMAFANAVASMGIEVESGGSSVSRVLTDMSKAAQMGGDDLLAFAETAGMSAAEFATAFREDPAEAFAAFIEGLGGVQEAGGNVFAILDQLGLSDVRVSQALLGMASSGDLLRESLDLGAEAWQENTALVEEAAKRYDTTAAKTEMARNALNDAAIEIGETFLPVMASLAESVADVATWFAELPAPIQATIGGLASVAGVGALAGGAFLLLAPRVMDTYKAFQVLKTASPGVASGLGRVGKAAGIAGVLIAATAAAEALGNAMDDAPPSMEATTSALLKMGSSVEGVDAQLRALGTVDDQIDGVAGAAERLTDPSMLDRFNDFGGSLQNALSLGIVGSSEGAMARAAIIDQFDQMGQSLALMVQSGNTELAAQQFGLLAAEWEKGGGTVAELRELMPAYADALKAIDNEQRANAESARLQSESTTLLAQNADLSYASLQNYAAALGLSEDATAELITKSDELGESLGAFVDPLGAYTGLLEQKRAAEEETARKTAEQTDSMSDSWEDYFTEVDVSFEEYMVALQEQVAAQDAWQLNMLLLAGRVSQGTLDELSRMGPEGAPLVADLVNRSDAELDQFDDITAKRSKEAMDAWGAQLTMAAPVLAAIGQKAGQGVVNELVRQLAAGTTTVAAIAAQYGINLAAGINPILSGLGKPEIDAFGSVRPRGFVGPVAPFMGPVQRNADGNLYEQHAAEIAPAGAWRVWAEPETGGEAYIPLSPSKRARSLSIWRETGRRLGAGTAYAFGGINDVPRPPSTAPYRSPISTPADAAMAKAYGDTVDWLKANLAPQLGSGVGYQAMMTALRGQFPGLQLISGMRPGAITATGNRSYHSMGRAVDIPPQMAPFNWIAENYGAKTRELIFSPAGGRQLHNGRPHVYGEPTRGDHWDHVHWAMRNGGILRMPSYQTGTNFVPQTGPALLHRGERVVPAEQNAALGGPLDLSDSTIEKLAVAMIRGADSVVGGALVAVHNRTAY